MNNINTLISILDKEIIKMTNTVEKINMASSLTKVIDLITKDTIWNFTKDDLDELEKKLEKYNGLTLAEKQFLSVFANMPDMVKKIKKKIELSIEQVAVIEQINSKIKEYQQSEISTYDINVLENALKSYKELLQKFKQNDMNLITEIELISKIMNDYGISFNEQMLIYMEINRINNKIFSRYNIPLNQVKYDEEEVTLADLKETNMPNEQLEALFSEFNIKWDMNIIEFNEKDKQQVMSSLIEYKNNLLKYGNYDKMRAILRLLKSNDLEFISEMPEILTRILLYTSPEDLVLLFDNLTNMKVNIKSKIQEEPFLLYPAVREIECKIGKKSKKDRKNQGIKSGALKNFNNCCKFLESNGYNVDLVHKNCKTLFISSIKTVAKTYDNLNLYGINLDCFKDGDAFSVLRTTNILDKLDKAIECNSFNYYNSNLTRLFIDNNFYKVKYALSDGVPIDEIFRKPNQRIMMNGSFRNNNDYGKTEEETFKLYGAIEYNSPKKELYDKILEKNDSDSIDFTLLNNNTTLSQIDTIFKDPNNELEYNFNGVIISRYKVLRTYQALLKSPNVVPNYDLLMYSITRLSMLTATEMKILEKCIKNPLDYKGKDMIRGRRVI